MLVRCNRPGGFALRTPDGDQVKLDHGINEVDANKFAAAMGTMPEQWQTAVFASAKHGVLPDLENVDSKELAEAEKMSAVDKAKAVKAASSIKELNAMMEGEERKTVIDAANARLAELQAE